MGLVATEPGSENGPSTDSIEHQQILEQRREELEERLNGYRQQLANPERQKVSMGDTAIDGGTISDIQLQNSITSDQLALNQVNIALKKSEDGTYGVCEDCDEPIPQDRLDAQPDARYCVYCLTAREKNGGDPPTTLV